MSTYNERLQANNDRLEKLVADVNALPDYVPPGPKDPHTLLLIHGDKIEDVSAYGAALTNTNVVVSDAQSKFGGKSLYFNGSAHLFTRVPIGEKFTVDFWAYSSAFKRYPCWFDMYNTYGRSQGYSMQWTKDWLAFFYGQIQTASVPANSWHHFALVRDNETLMGFVDGKLIGTSVAEEIQVDTIAIGSLVRKHLSDGIVQGYLSEFRISDVARWTSDFTPADRPYDNIKRTIEPLEITENGVYNPPAGVDGFSPVTVNVSGKSKPCKVTFINEQLSPGASVFFTDADTDKINEVDIPYNQRREFSVVPHSIIFLNNEIMYLGANPSDSCTMLKHGLSENISGVAITGDVTLTAPILS